MRELLKRLLAISYMEDLAPGERLEAIRDNIRVALEPSNDVLAERDRLAAEVTRLEDDLTAAGGIRQGDLYEMDLLREQVCVLREALTEMTSRYIELFEAAGLGHANDSVAIEIVRDALARTAPSSECPSRPAAGTCTWPDWLDRARKAV